MTVVLDCNILVICLTSRSPWHFIYQSLVKGKFNIAVSTEIMLEYEEIIQLKYGVPTAANFIRLIQELPNVKVINPRFKWRLIEADIDDNKYCDCAIASNAFCIVTEDKHFSALKKIPFPAINVLSIGEFMDILKSNAD